MHTYSPKQKRNNPRLLIAGTLAVGLLISASLAGCVQPPPPYVAGYAQPAHQAHCFDGVPHMRGSKPFALGGACCCTPSDELMQKLHADGACTDLDTAGLKKLYADKGIQLASDHRGCNNLCAAGPHVVKGGKCMAPPTPGTRNYEEIVTGVVYEPAAQTKAK